MVGRVEPRKRQLEIAAIAAAQGLDLTIIGDLQSPNAGFGSAFTRLSDSNACIHYLGPLPHAETLRILADSRVLVNASWVEVQSLVDIEAASMGCFIAATPAGHSREWLGTHLTTVDDLADLGGLVRVAVMLARAPHGPPPLVYPQTWDQAAGQLLSEYLKAAG